MNEFYGAVIVRAMVILAATLCIFWGYRLFYISTEKQGEISASTGKEQHLKMRDVAPGIFFALFGAAILIFSLFHPVTYSQFTSDGSSVDSMTVQSIRR